MGAKVKSAKPTGATPEEKIRFTVLMQRDLVEQLRDIVVFTPGATLADAVAAAVGAYVKQRAKSFPGGKIPNRGGLAVKTGRPIR
jgi:hypothetical protein